MTTGSPRTTSGWAMGLVTFAGALMLMAGVFQAISGLAAIFDDEFYVVTQNYVFDLDASVWGWVHLLLGIVLGMAGWPCSAAPRGVARSESCSRCSVQSRTSSSSPTTRSGRS